MVEIERRAAEKRPQVPREWQRQFARQIYRIMRDFVRSVRSSVVHSARGMLALPLSFSRAGGFLVPLGIDLLLVLLPSTVLSANSLARLSHYIFIRFVRCEIRDEINANYNFMRVVVVRAHSGLERKKGERNGYISRRLMRESG